MKKFTYEWWTCMSKEAYWRYNNYAFRSYYLVVAEYCIDRAEEALWKK